MGSVLRLLLDAGFLFLLRFSLDDRVDGVIAAAVRALRALLVAPGDEVRRDRNGALRHQAPYPCCRAHCHCNGFAGQSREWDGSVTIFS